MMQSRKENKDLSLLHCLLASLTWLSVNVGPGHHLSTDNTPFVLFNQHFNILTLPTSLTAS